MRSVNHRSLRLEALERRQLLAGDVLHNYIAPLDVNDDSVVSSLDALAIINHINRRDSIQRDEAVREVSTRYFDVNDDTDVTPIDALRIVNWLNRSSLQAEATESFARVVNDGGTRASFRITESNGAVALQIRVQDLEPGATHEIYVEDEWIGFAIADDSGRAELRYEAESELFGHLPTRILDGLRNARIAVEGVGEILLERHSSSESDGNELGSDDDPSSVESDGISLLKASLENEGERIGHVLSLQREGQSRLLVFARGLEPGASYDLAIDGVVVTSLQANRHGIIARRLGNDVDVELPTILEGSTIELAGLAAGTFVPVGDGIVRPPVRPEAPTLYVASFTSESRIRGGATAASERGSNAHGINALGRAAGQSYDIAIDGQEVATVTANRLGAIVFHYNSRRGEDGRVADQLPHIGPGSVISIGDLARGEFSAVRNGRT